MITYEAEQIRRFLKEVDKHLSKTVRLVIIGGGAALLQHGARSPTRDIDAFEGDPSLLKDASARAEAAIGFSVPIGRAAVADLPLNYEDRQLRVMPELRRLQLIVPDRYDLVLSKLVRASQTDLVVCNEIHEHAPLNARTLVERYLDEMSHAVGRQADRDQNLIAAIELMWDATVADWAQMTVDARRAKERRATSRRSPNRKQRG
jgi:hypothetical protein